MKSRKAGTVAGDDATAIAAARFVVVDTELTGLDEKRDAVVSIGAVRMTGGTISLGDSFYRLVNPEKQLTADSIVIHEITPSDVAEKPGIASALAEFLEYCGQDVLVGHFISLDLAFLNREMKKATGAKMANPVVDTCSMYEWLRMRPVDSVLKGPTAAAGSYRLFDVAKRFDVPVEQSHNALQDAFATAQLFQRFIPLLREAGVTDLGTLFRIGAPFDGRERLGPGGEIYNF